MIENHNHLHCLICGKEFESLGKRYKDEDGHIITPGKFFHDIHCLDTVWDKEQEAMIHPEKRGPIELHCVKCGKPFMAEFGGKGWTDGQKFCSAECGLEYAKEETIGFLDLVNYCPPDTVYRICMDGGKLINKRFKGRNLFELPQLEKIKKYGVRNYRITNKGVVVFDIHTPE